jgi:DNA-binding transcriptional LysR family regulator
MLNEIQLSRIDLNLLSLFETIYAARHLGRAADELHLSPSAVSHGLRRLRRLLNDPLFTRTPKGVVPTDRAIELEPLVREALTVVRAVLAQAQPFDPLTSARVFRIGVPDATGALVLPGLISTLTTAAPRIDLRVVQLLPREGETSIERAWQNAVDRVESRALDIAIVPFDNVPVRFAKRHLFDDRFVIALRAGHPAAALCSLQAYSELQHVVVSTDGDARGFVDEVLAASGLSRRVVLTVPNFHQALSLLAETDFVAAVPERFASLHAERFGLTSILPPVDLGTFPMTALASEASLADEGVAWLFEVTSSVIK